MAGLCQLTLLTLASSAASLQVQDDILITHNLTICNAYADTKSLSVYALSSKAKLTEEPLEYKECKALSLEMAQGERLDFKLGGLSVGTFHAAGLSTIPSSLLLVPRRRANTTMSAAFSSHMFAPTEQAQLAIVDAVAGGARGSVRVRMGGDRKQRSVGELLQPGSVASLLPGPYDVSMEDATGKEVKAVALQAGSRSKHIVMQVGGAEGYSQELVVFPGTAAHSGSLRAGLGLLGAAVAAVALARAFAAA